MNIERHPSEELKNAFVDGELAATERRAVQHRLLGDETLRRELCELNAVKGLVREAYGGFAQPRSPAPAAARRSGPLRAMAFALGFAAIGWVANATMVAWSGGGSEAITLAQLMQGAVAMPAATGHERVLLHVSSRDHENLRATLDAAEALLEGAARASRRVEVEIVANSGGMDLLRAGVSPEAERIARLQARYPALVLVACNQTIDRLRERGESVALLPGVRVAPSALDEIVARLHKGWLYVRS